METALWDRIQFAFTVMFHYLFPIVTMGLAPFIAVFWLVTARTGNPRAESAARLWTRVFAINFAAGVVTGIPMEFQFGTNWAAFSARTGAVMGQPLTLEAMFAFFSESVFLGALLYGRRVLRPALLAVSGVVVWLASWLSGFFIITANAWMQHPVGYSVARDGTIQLTNIGAVLLSPFAWAQFTHAITGAVVTGSFLVAGVGAFYLLARRDEAVGRMFLRWGVICAFVASCSAVFPTGDTNGKMVTEYQPVKLAALEGSFHSQASAPLAILGMPDVGNMRLLDPVEVPGVLSFLAYGNFTTPVRGLEAFPRDQWPPVALTYYAYHVMVGLGTIFCAIGAVGVLLLWRGALFRARWYWWIALLALPFPAIANEAGWASAEVGRQPWLIYGLMRTDAGISPTVVAGETIFTVIGFAGVYLLLGILYLFLILREILNGPRAAPETNAPSATTPTVASAT